ncbi:chromatin regulatory protein Sir2 [Apiospora sp. TS-2023a]
MIQTGASKNMVRSELFGEEKSLFKEDKGYGGVQHCTVLITPTTDDTSIKATLNAYMAKLDVMYGTMIDLEKEIKVMHAKSSAEEVRDLAIKANQRLFDLQEALEYMRQVLGVVRDGVQWSQRLVAVKIINVDESDTINPKLVKPAASFQIMEEGPKILWYNARKGCDPCVNSAGFGAARLGAASYFGGGMVPSIDAYATGFPPTADYETMQGRSNRAQIRAKYDDLCAKYKWPKENGQVGYDDDDGSDSDGDGPGDDEVDVFAVARNLCKADPASSSLYTAHGRTTSASLSFFEVAAAHRFLKDSELRGFGLLGGRYMVRAHCNRTGANVEPCDVGGHPGKGPKPRKRNPEQFLLEQQPQQDLPEVGIAAPAWLPALAIFAGAYDPARVSAKVRERPICFIAGREYLLESYGIGECVRKIARFGRHSSNRWAWIETREGPTGQILCGPSPEHHRIPELRSKDTGPYAKQAQQGLAINDPREVLDIRVFNEDPTIFFTVAKEILPSLVDMHGFADGFDLRRRRQSTTGNHGRILPSEARSRATQENNYGFTNLGFQPMNSAPPSPRTPLQVENFGQNNSVTSPFASAATLNQFLMSLSPTSGFAKLQYNSVITAVPTVRLPWSVIAQTVTMATTKEHLLAHIVRQWEEEAKKFLGYRNGREFEHVEECDKNEEENEEEHEEEKRRRPRRRRVGPTPDYRKGISRSCGTTSIVEAQQKAEFKRLMHERREAEMRKTEATLQKA